MSRRTRTIGVGAAAAAIALAAAGGVSLANAQDGEGADSAPRHGRADLEPLTADEVRQATEAALGAVAGGAVLHVLPRHQGDEGYAVAVVQDDDSRVLVLLDGGFGLVEVRDAPERRGRPGLQEATGEEASKAGAAARERVADATVQRIVVRPDGGYAVAMETGDGTRRIVLLDSEFAVERVTDGPEWGPRGQRLTGQTRTEVEEAALAEVGEGEVLHSREDADGYLAVVRTDDGFVRVELDESFRVTGTEAVDHPRPPGARGFGPGHGGPGHAGHGPGGPGFGWHGDSESDGSDQGETSTA